MTESRIRWSKEDDGGTAGRAGTLDEPLFFIYPPESPGKAHILTAMLPGHTRDFYPTGFVSDLKAKAEEWLAEFVSSFGAVFPQPCPTEAVFSDGRVPCTLSRNHAEPHEFGDTVLPFASDIPGTTAATTARED